MAKIAIWVLIFFIATSCDNGKSSKQGSSKDSLSQNFSDIFIDSVAVSSFSKTNNTSDSIGWEVNQFYKRRNYQFAWFNKGGMTYAVSIFYNQLQNYIYNFADNGLKNPRFDTLISATQKDEKKFMSRKNDVKQLELLLTTTFFKYAKKAYGGVAKNVVELEWFIPRQKKNYQVALDSMIELPKGGVVQIPLNEFYFRLKKQLKKYRDIEKTSGFPTITPPKNKLSLRDIDSSLLSVKRYFYLTGDLKTNDGTIVFTDSLMNAVKNFQLRMGLVINGSLDSATVLELNKPIAFRIQQMMINMERLRWVPVEMEKDYLLINIPEFKLHVFENGKPVWVTNIVVGTSVTQTSIFKGNISQIVLNPYWGVPTSIVENEIVPHIKANSAYLTKNNIEVFSGNKIINPDTIHWDDYKTNVPFTFRQRPGKNNALGKVLFLFPNNFDIYLHDTPSKNLFGDTKRAFSHGCIRVADPKKLALYILRYDVNWSAKKIEKILETDKEVRIQISPNIPIYIVYFTSWVDDDGQLNFRNDLYNLDSKLSNEIFGN